MMRCFSGQPKLPCVIAPPMPRCQRRRVRLPPHLAGLQASLISARVNGLTMILETCYHGDNNGSAIIYTFELDTDADHIKADRLMLDAMLANFRTISFTK
jgi:hypothetical protein